MFMLFNIYNSYFILANLIQSNFKRQFTCHYLPAIFQKYNTFQVTLIALSLTLIRNSTHTAPHLHNNCLAVLAPIMVRRHTGVIPPPPSDLMHMSVPNNINLPSPGEQSGDFNAAMLPGVIQHSSVIDSQMKVALNNVLFGKKN